MFSEVFLNGCLITRETSFSNSKTKISFNKILLNVFTMKYLKSTTYCSWLKLDGMRLEIIVMLEMCDSFWRNEFYNSYRVFLAFIFLKYKGVLMGRDVKIKLATNSLICPDKVTCCPTFCLVRVKNFSRFLWFR